MKIIKQEQNFNVPNALTMLRIVLLPAYIWHFWHDNLTAALVVFLIAQLSDLLDGFLARRWNQITYFGKLVDPLADKLTQLTVLLCFGFKRLAPWWVIGLVMGKEALMIVGGIWALRKKIVVAAMGIGKVSTALFAAAVVLTLLQWKPADAIVLYAAVAVSMGALGVYSANMWRIVHAPSAAKEAERE